MYNTELSYLIAQQHADELRRTADRQRRDRSILADPRPAAPRRRIARLRLAFASRG